MHNANSTQTAGKSLNLSTLFLCQSTVPFTSTMSFKRPPIFTTPHRTIRGSIATVFLTSSCTEGEASKRMMKWWPLSCRAWFFLMGFVRRKGPQLVMPRTTPPWARIRAPAVRAILESSGKLLCDASSTQEWDFGGSTRRPCILFYFTETFYFI